MPAGDAGRSADRSRMPVPHVSVHQKRLHRRRAWLTAATGVGEAIIIAGANGYLSLAKSDHKRGGITFEAAKANNFRTDTEDDGGIDSPAI